MDPEELYPLDGLARELTVAETELGEPVLEAGDAGRVAAYLRSQAGVRALLTDRGLARQLRAALASSAEVGGEVTWEFKVETESMKRTLDLMYGGDEWRQRPGKVNLKNYQHWKERGE